MKQVPSDARDILPLAVWFGLAAGLIEGLVFLLFLFLLQFDWVSRDILLPDVAVEIIWISPLFNGLLFGAIGLGLAALFSLARMIKWLPVAALSVSLFSFLSFLDWLALLLSRRIHHLSLAILAAGLAAAFTRYVRKREERALRFWRRSLPWLAAAVALVFAGVESGGWLRERMAIAALPPAPPAAPNVLMIVVDTLRADHLSGYGYARPTSPRLDRLAREGALFESAFSTSSWTAPSHASLLTGRHPHEHGVEWRTPRALLDGRYPTLAEALKDRGYRTAAFSANPFWFTRPMGFGRGFIRFEDFFQSLSDMALRTFFGRAFEQMVLRRLGIEDFPARKRAADINRSVLRWVERDREKPFFAFLNYMDTHDPYLPPEPFRSKFSRTPAPGGIINTRLGRYHPTMTPEELQGEIDAYDGAIAYVDEQIGQLIDELQRRSLLDRTVVVVTSDHGESFGERGFLLHANSLYRETIHVPLIFRYPEKAPAGVRVTQPVTNAAAAATVMELVGAGQQTIFPGPSLVQLCQPCQPGRTPQASASWSPPLTEIERQPWSLDRYPVSRGWIKSLVSSEWHYIRHENLQAEIYNWKDDTREERNLIGNPRVESATATLHSRLQGFFPQLKETPAP
jgi:arylsulfatase A-like enzyme